MKIIREETRNLGGSGIYWSKNTWIWNVKKDNHYYSKLSVTFHFFNKVLRFYWGNDA
jgi:hypothetical protein